jgi:hypothetical protein
MLRAAAHISRSARLYCSKIWTKFCEIQFYRYPSKAACHYLCADCLTTLSASTNYIVSIILPVVLYGCQAWSLTLREERRLRVVENGVLRIFGLERDQVTEVGENCIMRNFITCTLLQI